MHAGLKYGDIEGFFSLFVEGHGVLNLKGVQFFWSLFAFLLKSFCTYSCGGFFLGGGGVGVLYPLTSLCIYAYHVEH